MAEKEPFNPEIPDKFSQEEKKKIAKMFEKLKGEIPYEFDVTETPDTITVKTRDEKKGTVEMGFTKVRDKIILKSGEHYSMSDVIEARLRFPGEQPEEALSKLKKLREEENKSA